MQYSWHTQKHNARTSILITGIYEFETSLDFFNQMQLT